MTAKNKNEPEIENILSEYQDEPVIEGQETKKETRGRKRKSKFKTTVEGKEIISGFLLLLVIDIIFPNIIMFVNNKFAKEKIKSKGLQLTKEQRNELQPIADEVAKEIMLNASPILILTLALGSIYFTNYLSLKNI